MTKPTKWLCAQQRLRSAWASAQTDQSLCCALKTQDFFMWTAKTVIRLIWVFPGRTAILLVLSCRGSIAIWSTAQEKITWMKFWHSEILRFLERAWIHFIWLEYSEFKVIYARITTCALMSSLIEKKWHQSCILNLYVSVVFMKILQWLVLALRLKRKYCFNNSRTSWQTILKKRFSPFMWHYGCYGNNQVVGKRQ